MRLPPALVLALLVLPLAVAHTNGGVMGTAKTYFEPTNEWFMHDYLAGTPLLSPVDGCPLCSDGHGEWAWGGAHILVDSGLNQASIDPNLPAGSLYCYGADGHHPYFGPVRVDDTLLGASASFEVAADQADLTALGQGCGDFLEDAVVACVGACTMPFLPGLDGAYRVYVAPPGSSGHVLW